MIESPQDINAMVAIAGDLVPTDEKFKEFATLALGYTGDECRVKIASHNINEISRALTIQFKESKSLQERLENIKKLNKLHLSYLINPFYLIEQHSAQTDIQEAFRGNVDDLKIYLDFILLTYAHHKNSISTNFSTFVFDSLADDFNGYDSEKTKILINFICGLLTNEKPDVLRTSFSENSKLLFQLTKFCIKENYFEPLNRIVKHFGGREVLDICNSVTNLSTDWNKAKLTPQDLLNDYILKKHSEFSAWKALKFMGTVAGCAIFVWGNIQPILKENQKFNALIACLGLSAAVVTGFSSYFFKVDPANHGVPNELFTAR